MSVNNETKDYDLEEVYDTEIAPLIRKIHRICAEHKMPMLALFSFSRDSKSQTNGIATTYFNGGPHFNQKLDFMQHVAETDLAEQLNSATAMLRDLGMALKEATEDLDDEEHTPHVKH